MDDLLRWQAIAATLGALAAVMYGQARYWRAKAETMEAEHDDGGWIAEARFWRRHYDKEAAEFAEEHDGE